MNKFKRYLVAAVSAGALSVLVWLGLAGLASAQQQSPSTIECQIPIVQPASTDCDLAIDKQVSVNGGAYVDANTSGAAAKATVGDTVTWKITVSDNSSPGLTPEPYSVITVSDVLPGGVTMKSSTPSAGTYTSNAWNFDLTGGLPQSLTITSKAIKTGVFKNTAAFSVLDSCGDECIGVYTDADPGNNSNDAWIDISAKPVVLAASTTLANTGNGVVPSLIAGSLIAAALGIALAGRRGQTSQED